MKRGVLVAWVAFGAILAVIVGARLQEASLAVVAGVVCGIVAGLPVSVALLYMLWRERQERLRAEQRWQNESRPAIAPPVFILNGSRGAETLPGGLSLGLGESRPRDFVIVGEEEGQRRETEGTKRAS